MRQSVVAIMICACLLQVSLQEVDRQSYLTYLLAEKQALEEILKKIENVNSNLHVNMQLSNSSAFQEHLLVSALRDESSLLVEALSHTFIGLTEKSGCGAAGNDEIYAKVSEMQAELKKVKETVEKQESCVRNDIIKNNFGFYEMMAEGLAKETHSDCSIIIPAANSRHIPFLDIISSKYIPNASTTQPWIFGQITPQEFSTKSSQLVSLNGAVACPENMPFLDDNNACIACASGQIYDISFKKCQSCQTGTVYDSVSHSCNKQSVLFNSNLAKNANYLGTAPTQTPGLSFCPDDKPYFNGNSCISCALPLYFNFASNTCIACAIGSAFSNTAQSCTGKSFFLSNLGNNSNYIGSPLSPLPYDSIMTCSSEKPFSDGKQCYSCPLPQFFNFERMSCQSCPSGYSFQSTSHSCESTSSTVSFFNSNLIGHRNFNGKIPLFNNLFRNCGQDSPFFDGKQCVSCSLPSYFDFDIKTCTSCQSGLAFNALIQTCEYIKQDFSTNFQAQNIYYNGNFQEVKQSTIQRRAGNSNISICPLSTPYYNSRTNTCIACSDGLSLFDLKSNKCISCPSGSVYSGESHICLTDKVPATIERMIMNAA